MNRAQQKGRRSAMTEEDKEDFLRIFAAYAKEGDAIEAMDREQRQMEQKDISSLFPDSRKISTDAGIRE